MTTPASQMREDLTARPSSSVPARRAGTLLVALLGLALGLWNLTGPELWWDEGWTLSVARSWAERGHYGRLLDGQLAPPGLEASFVVTAPVALSFRLFGVGIWQGRLPGVLATLAALALLYRLAERLYSRRVAVATLGVALLLPMHPQLHALILGRQVLAELPMLCYLLAGYLCLWRGLRRPAWLAAAALLWGAALLAKTQVFPFWLASLGSALLLAPALRRWRAAAALLVALLGALAASRALVWLWLLAIAGHTLPGTSVTGLYDVTAFVPNLFNRSYALSVVLLFATPTTIALLYALWRLARNRAAWAADAERELIRLALLALAGSWLAWFALLSVGVPRYLFPATFVGSMFVAAWLSELTEGFAWGATLRRASGLLRPAGRRAAGAALLAMLVLAASLPITLQTLASEYLLANDQAAPAAAAWLNTQTATDARIETYESELHFLLERRYHYPPDQMHVELNRRGLLHQDVSIDYDPLAWDPDYLVVGRFARGNDLYGTVIETAAFRLVRQIGRYDIYQRIR